MNKRSGSFYKDSMSAIFSSISSNGVYIPAPRVFFELTHDISLSAMIAQLIFWCDRAVRSDGFVYKSSRDWYNELGVSNYAVRKFKKLPFIITRIIRANGSPTTHYLIDMELLKQSVASLELFPEPISTEPTSHLEPSTASNEPVDGFLSTTPQVDSDRTLTKITTKNTTKTTTLKEGPPIFFNEPTLVDQDLEEDGQDTITLSLRFQTTGTKEQQEAYNHFLHVLSDITGFDLALKKTANRLVKSANDLLRGGYTAVDLPVFLEYWKENDWRWQKNQQLPTPEDVQCYIYRSKNYRQNKKRLWLGQD